MFVFCKLVVHVVDHASIITPPLPPQWAALYGSRASLSLEISRDLGLVHSFAVLIQFLSKTIIFKWPHRSLQSAIELNNTLFTVFWFKSQLFTTLSVINEFWCLQLCSGTGEGSIAWNTWNQCWQTTTMNTVKLEQWVNKYFELGTYITPKVLAAFFGNCLQTGYESRVRLDLMWVVERIQDFFNWEFGRWLLWAHIPPATSKSEDSSRKKSVR
jgi:hypothetical protein